MNKLLLTVLSMLSLNLLASTDRIYMSPMEQSTWALTKNSSLGCAIEHVIPGFGKAVFSQQSGRKLTLKFVSNLSYKKNLDISFRSVTASWKGTHTEANIANLKTSGTNPLVKITSNAARKAYLELQQGHQPSLFFIDEEDASKSVSVILSTIKFRDIEEDFGACLNRLAPYNYYDVRVARVYFGSGEEFPALGAEDRVFANMLNYLKLDKSIKNIRITGYTDHRGSACFNKILSARRAQYIYDYLVQSDIAPEMLQIEFNQGKSSGNKGKRMVEVTLLK